jgi:hypothetical protein
MRPASVGSECPVPVPTGAHFIREMPAPTTLRASAMLRALPGALLMISLAGPCAPALPPGQALELNGSTMFVRAPWMADLF